MYEGRGILVQVAGAVRGNPVLSVSLLCALFSIAGIPPLLGFLGKWLVLMGGVAEGYYYFACFVLLCSGVAGFYYLRVIKLVCYIEHCFNFLLAHLWCSEFITFQVPSIDFGWQIYFISSAGPSRSPLNNIADSCLAP